MNDRKALVLGATGGIGGETAAALLRHGWTVVAMARGSGPPSGRTAGALAGASWATGDASVAADVRRAADGVQAIIHAVNPPGYRDWDRLVLPMIDNSIAAARLNGARVVLPGTIYNYGPDAFPVLTEEAPQNPLTRKGRIRVELERRLEAGSRAGVPALIVRFGDFFGPPPGNSWFSQGLVKPGRRLDAITNPGRRRPCLGVPAGRGRNDRAPAGPVRRAGTVRPLPPRRHLGCGRDRNGACDRAGRWTS